MTSSRNDRRQRPWSSPAHVAFVGLISAACSSRPSVLAKESGSSDSATLDYVGPVDIHDDEGEECSLRDARFAFLTDDLADEAAIPEAVVVPLAHKIRSGLLVSPLKGSAITLQVESAHLRTYQWQQKHRPDDDWHDLPSEKSSSIVLPALGGSSCSELRCMVTMGMRSAVTETVYVVPHQPAPIFAQDLPAEITVRDGQSATLRVRLAGVRTDLLRWYRARRHREFAADESPRGAPSQALSLSRVPLMWISGDDYALSTGPLHLRDDGDRFFVEAVHYGETEDCGESGVARSRGSQVHVVP